MQLAGRIYYWQLKKYNMLEREPQPIRQGEVQPEQKEVKKDGLEILKGDIRERFLELREEGVPVDERLRININEFGGVYSKDFIESCRKYVKDLKAYFKAKAMSGSKSSWAFPKKEVLKETPMGEIFEMLKTSIFQEKLGKDFIVTRTSEYDDLKNNVDNIILERETGNIVCAFDEVGADSGEIFEEKKEEVSKKNLEGKGADLAYGIFFEKKAGKMELKKGKIEHMPIFYLSMSEEEIKNNLDNPERREESFYSFIDSIKKQIKELKEHQLHSKLKERLDSFEKVIEKL